MLLAAVQSSGARRWDKTNLSLPMGGGVLLAPHRATPSASGPDRCSQRGSGCTRSEPRALGAKCSVTLALERVTIASPFCLFVGPPTEEASLLLGTDNIRFASCVPF